MNFGKISELPSIIDYKMEKLDFLSDVSDQYELWFNGTNNGKIYAKCLFSKCSNPVPVVFYYHGY